MTKLLKEVCGAGLPSDFKQEIEKSALHVVGKSGNNSLLNIDTVVELDDIVELETQAEKLQVVERIFKNIDTPVTNNSVDNNNNNENIIL